MHDYRKLDVWTKSHELALDVCRASAAWGSDADGHIRDTLRRAAVAIPVMLVLGCEAETAPEFARAMRSAASAVDEFAYLLRFARDADVLAAVPYAKLEARTNQLRAMLGGLNRTVRLKLGAEARPAEAVARAAGAVPRATRGVPDDGSSRRGFRPRPTS